MLTLDNFVNILCHYILREVAGEAAHVSWKEIII